MKLARDIQIIETVNMYLGNQDFMAPHPFDGSINFGPDLTNNIGVKGQGQFISTPSQKVFERHYLVYVDPTLNITSGATGFTYQQYNPACPVYNVPPGPLFDPSYGAYYLNAGDFECKALEGYAALYGPTSSPDTEFYIVRSTPYVVPPSPTDGPNITIGPLQ